MSAVFPYLCDGIAASSLRTPERSGLPNCEIQGAEIIAAVVSIAGLILTLTLLPEPKGKSLEELSADALAPPTPVLRLEVA
jgi:hypothetical protein